MSTRFITAALFGAAAIYVGFHNRDDGGSVLVFPILGSLVGPDPQEQGRATVGLLAAVAVLFLVRDLLWWRRSREDDGS